MRAIVSEVLLSEYAALVSKLQNRDDDEQLLTLLVNDAEWTPQGARIVAELARFYGTSVLRNALALASALDIEDGELGL